MDVRLAQPADHDGIESVLMAAFGAGSGGELHGREVVELVRALDASAATRASVVAVDGEVVGHVRLSRGWIDARRALVEAAVLSPLAVTPRRQREGIGAHLLIQALAEAERLGFPAVFLEGDWDYYGPRGFAAATEYGFFRPSLRIPLPAFQVALLPSYENWMVGQLIYPEAVWVTDSTGLRDPRLRAVEERL